MINIDVNVMVANRVINLKNHLVENIRIRPFRSLPFRILAIATNVLAKIKMNNHKLLYAKKMNHLENVFQDAIIVINQSLLL
jgi:hypothetical protein